MNLKKIHTAFSSFAKSKVLIIGDVMLDSYLWGSVDRISPEAPVPVVTVKTNENRLGGAANVALNIQSLGATPVICSIIGKDEKGEVFLSELKKRTISAEGIIQSADRKTTVKTRIIGHSQQMLRVDEEITRSINKKEENEFISSILHFVNKDKIDVIVFQDYDKGVITPLVIKKIVEEANKKSIPITVDPKKRNFSAYKDITLFKPNLKELKEGIKTDFNPLQTDELVAVVKQLQQLQRIEIALITLSDKGVLISTSNKHEIIPAHRRNVADVSGAGDTVISVASLCLAAKLSPSEVATISNLAGGLVCEEVGVVPIDKARLLAEIGKINC